MKIQLLFLLFFYLSTAVYSQLTSFKVESYNKLENNTKLIYLNINGVESIEQADFLQARIVKNQSVLRFTFPNKLSDLSNCIIQTDQSLDNIELERLINEILIQYKEKQEIIIDLPEYVNTGNPENDNEIYRLKKKEWIKNNPEKYKRLIENNESNEGLQEKQTKQTITN